MLIERVENRDRTSLSIYRIDLWRLPKGCDFETHFLLNTFRCIDWQGVKKISDRGRRREKYFEIQVDLRILAIC